MRHKSLEIVLKRHRVNSQNSHKMQPNHKMIGKKSSSLEKSYDIPNVSKKICSDVVDEILKFKV